METKNISEIFLEKVEKTNGKRRCDPMIYPGIKKKTIVQL